MGLFGLDSEETLGTDIKMDMSPSAGVQNHPADGAPSAGFWRSTPMNADEIIFFSAISGRYYYYVLKFYSRRARARALIGAALGCEFVRLKSSDEVKN